MQNLLILKICALIIVVGLAILAFDRYYVRRDQPSEGEQLARLSEEHQLDQQSPRGEQAARILELLRAHHDITGNPQQINTLLSRSEGASTLRLIEFDTREFALYRGNGQTSRVNVALVAVLIEFDADAGLPDWNQALNPDPPQPPFGAEALARLRAMDDYRMATGSHHALFVSQRQGPALIQAINQSVSADFHPGLLNSAMAIDVQRAVDIANLLEAPLPQVARFYQIEVPELKIDLPDRPVSAGLDEIVQQTHDQIAAQREQWAAEDAQRQAEWQRTLDELKAKRERQAAEREAQRERRMAETRARMDASLEAAKAGRDATEDSGSAQ
ncbi:MAG: hypothetical protein KDI71_11380 [Xanthomonadales bacterium]|nr:hypothetical protein [Xanthomonadales bacterium]